MKVGDILRRVGPAFIVGAVIIGPGSVTLMSKTGSIYGYQMLWLSFLAGGIMAGFIAMFMRFGIYGDDTFLGLTAKKLGRVYAAVTGVSVSLVNTMFQFGNCLGVTAAMTLLFPNVPKAVWPVFFTLASILFLFGFKRIYKILERTMQFFLIVMLAAFVLNLIVARPNILEILKGLIPSIPARADAVTLGGLVATTFVLVAASFQSYLVKAKGWNDDDLVSGTTDTVLASVIFTLIGSVIMMTAASVLYPNTEVKSATDLAYQLGGVFGDYAKVIFCVGFWAAAFSSFVTNSLIGGVHLCDGLGLGGRLEQRATKAFATIVMLVGMFTALAIIHFTPPVAADAAGEPAQSQIEVTAIMLAQAMTLLAIPLATIATVLVLFDGKATKGRPLSAWALGFVVFGAVLLLTNAAMTAMKIGPKIVDLLAPG
jgi:manganese transport protein